MSPSGPIWVKGKQSPVFGTDRPEEPTPEDLDDYEFIVGYAMTAEMTAVYFRDIDTTTYAHLIVRYSAKGKGTSSIPVQMAVKINEDVGAPVSPYQTLNSGEDRFSSDSVASEGFSGQFGGPLLGLASYGSQDAAEFDYGWWEFPYANSTTKYKHIYANGATLTGAFFSGTGDNNFAVSQQYGHWKHTDPITILKFYITNGANFVSGSEFSLYGIRAHDMTSISAVN